MKRIKVGKKEYFWNEFFDFIFEAVGPDNTKERIFKSHTKKYKDLAARKGWVKLS